MAQTPLDYRFSLGVEPPLTSLGTDANVWVGIQ